MNVPKRIMQIAVILALLIFCVLMALYPSETWHASVRGYPSGGMFFSLPVSLFVLSELLLGFGIVHFLGTLLNPLMRPIFRVPGSGGFVFAVSCASGYPTGAKLTAQLWEQKLVTREEGERLVSFTTSSDPIFMIGAVSVGFFHNTAIAPILVASHYAAAFLVGVLMRFHGNAASVRSQDSLMLMKGIVTVSFMPSMRCTKRDKQMDGHSGNCFGTRSPLPSGLLLS